MTWPRVRVLPLLGVLCLAGQGTLLYLAGRGPEAPRAVWPVLFIALTAVLSAVLLAWGRYRVSSPRQSGGRGLQFVAVAAAAVLLLAGGLLALAPDGAPDSAGPSPADEMRIEDASRRLLSVVADLDRAAPAMAAGVPPPSSEDPGDGDLFRQLATVAGIWSREHGGRFSLSLVAWSDVARIAWTDGARPLPSWPGFPSPPDSARTLLAAAREGWVLRRLLPVAPGIVLECQLPLTGPGSGLQETAIEMRVVPAAEDTLAGLPARGRPIDLGLTDGHRVLLFASADGTESSSLAYRARLLLIALLAWTIALVAVAHRAGRLGWALAAAWIARAFLASCEARSWIGSAFSLEPAPPPPGSWFSLIDPAYFATPFLFGWFASVADALLTAVLLGWTIRGWLRARGLIAGADDGAAVSPVFGGGLRGGAMFGVAAGVVLIAVRAWTGIVAANANPRLIGTGASLPSLPFWGLHAVLMLVGFSAVCALTGMAAAGSWPTRHAWPRRLGAALLAAAIAGALNAWSAAGAGTLLAALLTALIWLGAPALLARPRFLRRFAWPAVVLVAVIWIHGGLNQHYNRAERAWLQHKASLMTDTDRDWTRYLLGSVLAEMQEQDELWRPAAADEMWQDEPAWNLWRDSALHDLGYSCLVEIMDEDERSVAVFARGFLRDYRFEVVDRSEWEDAGASLATGAVDVVFQTERRVYLGGEEEVLVAEAPRRAGRGWLRVELPVRSWRIPTLAAELTGGRGVESGQYRPRTEVDRPVLLLLADDTGWLRSGSVGFPGPEAATAVARLRSGDRTWAVIPADGDDWVCMWQALPADQARTAGEGFLLGLRQPGLGEELLDLSRLMMLYLLLFFVLFVAIQGRRWLAAGRTIRWHSGFQERFLAGYLVLGLVLLLVVGMSVDQVGYRRVRQEARSQTRDGLAMAVEQLRSLLAEQGRSLADSEYINDLLLGQLAGLRPAGSENIRQGMVFLADGTLVLDETLSDLSDAEAARLLMSARSAPMVVVRDDADVFVGTVIPIDLGPDIVAAFAPDDLPAAEDYGHGGSATNGFFFYRQRLDTALLGGLADLLEGEVTLNLEGRPVLASHPADYFAGARSLLMPPRLVATLLDHPQGLEIAAAVDRPFAFTGAQPVPSFAKAAGSPLVRQATPAILTVSFPDREREFAAQRRGTVLFLTGLATLILLTALLLAALMSWNLFRPLRLLLTATRSLAEGDFAAPLPDPGRDEVGRLAGAFGGMRAELEAARDDLAARERFLATVLERVPVGVAVLEPSGRVAALNPAGRQILASFWPDQDPQAGMRFLRDGFKRLAPGAGRAVGELVSADGRRTVRGALAPMDEEQASADAMVVFEDITEFLAHKKLALNAELARQVAHEIKNPLTPIQLSAQLLGQAWHDKHPQLDRIVDETVTRILTQVDLLRSIASEFSLLGRPDVLSTEALDLPDLVRRVVSAYAGVDAADDDPAAPPRVIQEDAGAVPAVLAHEESLVKILGNLMQNSLDAARPDARLEIRIGWRVDARGVTMIWCDNGAGLAPEVADRLFDPYFSTKSKGTGLGLAICRSLADRMGGTITLADHDEGDGAVAELNLPRADGTDIGDAR